MIKYGYLWLMPCIGNMKTRQHTCNNQFRCTRVYRPLQTPYHNHCIICYATLYDLVVVGGGPAGCFAAVQLCETSYPNVPKILILERASRILEKVRISGGGRCNVTNEESDPRVFAQHYPRGEKELIGPLTRFGSVEMKQWLKDRGVAWKTERDGRVFPVSDTSQTIIQCIQQQLLRYNVQVRLLCCVTGIERDNDGHFRIHIGGGKHQASISSRYVLVSTGSNRLAYRWIASLGHVKDSSSSFLCPSLFTFCIDDIRIQGLSGITVQDVCLKISSVSFRNHVQRGPLLITHWGLSGPAVLKLSAWGARTLAENNYKAQLSIDWLPSIHIEEIRSILTDTKHTWKTKQVTTTCPFRDKNGRQFLAKELWRNIVVHTLKTEDNAAMKKMWKDISKAQIAALSTALKSSIFEIRGKGIFKEEFVTCGGIGRKHVHFETMESKWIPGLYFAGEILDIDGLTGGFNLQAAWTTGYICGRSIAKRLEMLHRANDDIDGKDGQG
ncbi:hypothetical protein GAYE_SCF12G3346 [Galdieria yellowstonensis]|uniref:Flavoprotein n=1 Tax=Galdieria yellowstonensis TaxID=3028027 RepID=A0AAV9IDI1_9RHOD|nr:hypothetical protein GAYE_SCF12G3346 [Galdieria yellowstonensis]